jgi:hypothetical protein
LHDDVCHYITASSANNPANNKISHWISTMNRRELLQCAAILIGGASASQLGFTLTAAQKNYLAQAPNYNTGDIDYLTPSQRKIIASIAQVIIPKTDTPGAIEAGVPNFIELMVANWFNPQEQAIFLAGLKQLGIDTATTYGMPFDQLSSPQQLKLLEDMEAAAKDSAWYNLGNVQRQFISGAPFICQMKELTVWGFFSSEIGATQVLRYEPMPMYFDGDTPLAPNDSSWATPQI